MYDIYYDKHPDWMRLWSADFRKKKPSTESGGKQITLMAKVQAQVMFHAMKSVAQVERISGDLNRVSQKHVSRNIQPEMYPDLGVALVQAIAEIEPSTDPKVLDAWSQCYTYITTLFIDMEKTMYEEAKERKNGFIGFREFKIASKVQVKLEQSGSDTEDEEDLMPDNTVIEFIPIDGAGLPSYTPNQYVCVRVDTPKLGGITHRNYTLYGDSNEKSFKLSLNKMDCSIVTEALLDELKIGDVIQMSAPFGQFLLMETLVD